MKHALGSGVDVLVDCISTFEDDYKEVYLLEEAFLCLLPLACTLRAGPLGIRGWLAPPAGTPPALPYGVMVYVVSAAMECTIFNLYVFTVLKEKVIRKLVWARHGWWRESN
jgi:hypothetical protein